MKIIACLMIGRESIILKRCLESLRSGAQLDTFCISVNNTDNATYEVIKKYEAQFKVNIRIFKDKWSSFGENRSLSFQNTIKYAKELGFKLNECYALLIDADMALKMSNLDQFYSSLGSNAFMMLQKSRDMAYYNVRMIRLDQPAYCKYRTHEIWQFRNHIEPTIINPEIALFIDFNDGGSKDDKYRRDLKLLLMDLIDYPQDSRVIFYLAQTYLCLQKYEQAIINYKKRLELGGWIEEIWYSYYQLANCHLFTKRYKLAIDYFRQAINIISGRAEAYFGLAEIYNLKKVDKALIYYELCLKCDMTKYSLFIEHDKYKVLPLYRMANLYKIHGDYVNASQKLMLLVLDRDLGSKRAELARSELYTHVVKLEPDVKFVIPNHDKLSKSTNPSLLFVNDGLLVHTQKIHNSIDPNNKYIEIRNVFTKYDKDFNILEQFELSDLEHEGIVRGLKDIKLYYHGSQWGGIGCSYKMTNTAQQVIFNFDNHKFYNFQHISKSMRQYEKDWMPTLDGQYFIYSHHPLVVFNSHAKIVSQLTLANDLSFIRGSSQVVFDKTGYIAVVHSLALKEDQKEIYFHHLMRYDNQLKPTAISIPFKLSQEEIEFVCGLDIKDDKFYISYGVNDCQAVIAIFERSKIAQIPMLSLSL